MNPDTVTDDGSGILDGFFSIVDKGINAYTAIDAAKDKVASAKTAQTSVAPSKTATNAAGAVTLSPQTLAIAIAAVVAIGAVIFIARK